MTARAKPRTKAHEALTPAEVAALRAAADAAGGWRALARAWPEVSAATLARLASGSLATPIVLFVARVRLAQQPAPAIAPGTARTATCARHRAWYVARVEGRAWRWVRVDGPPAEVPSC